VTVAKWQRFLFVNGEMKPPEPGVCGELSDPGGFIKMLLGYLFNLPFKFPEALSKELKV